MQVCVNSIFCVLFLGNVYCWINSVLILKQFKTYIECIWVFSKKNLFRLLDNTDDIFYIHPSRTFLDIVLMSLI